MHDRPRLLAPAYLAAAVVGLIGNWYFVIAALPTERNYLGDFVSRTQPWGSTETLLLTGAALAFIGWEGWQRQVSSLWAHLVSVLVLGPICAVPLFLYRRELGLCRQQAAVTAHVLAR
ncbi:DUF2834 domain-containing protein [Micropruina sp.]|uniref:DUF2834 domain-containing protein n=1 Tax=Micropruina sp. TaxID=2737536 RepID=UPI0039E5734C